MPMQATYTPTAMDYDFALITLSQPASSSAGFLGMTVGTGSVTLNLTSAGYPVRARPSTSPYLRVFSKREGMFTSLPMDSAEMTWAVA